MRKVTISVASALLMATAPSAFATSKTVEVEISAQKNSATVEVTLNKGTYSFAAENVKTLSVSKGETVWTPGSVVIGENETKVAVLVELADVVAEATKVTVTYKISDESLKPIKAEYSQKVAAMINIASIYTGDAKLQELAAEASNLMAAVNALGMDKYNEYVVEGKIKDFDDKIASLTKQIESANTNFECYKYAQEKYGNVYDKGTTGWEPADGPVGLLLAKQNLAAALTAVLDETAKEAAKVLHDNAVKLIDQFLADAEEVYENAEGTDLNAYKATIDAKYNAVQESVVAAIKAIETGDDNALSYASVKAAIATAKNKYADESGSLYALLVTPKDGYNDWYDKAMVELNKYMLIINEVEAENNSLFAQEKCTGETKEELIGDLATILEDVLNDATPGILDVLAEYKATVGEPGDNPAPETLRHNFIKAKEDYKAALVDYLNEQVNDLLEREVGEKSVTRTEVKNHYAGDISAIDERIKAVLAEIEKVNAAHTIKTVDAGVYDKYNETKGAIQTDIDALRDKVNKSATEWDAWQDALGMIKNVKEGDGGFDKTKEAVNKKKSDDEKYKQNGKFTDYEKEIENLLSAIKDAADKSFKADGSGYSGIFLENITDGYDQNDIKFAGLKPKTDKIADYSKLSTEAMTNYNKVAKSISDANSALTNKDKTGLKDVATNLDVTLSGAVDGTATYGDTIAAMEKTIAKIQAEVDAAVAKANKEHVEAVGKLAWTKYFDAEYIKGLAEKYNTTLDAWNKNQLTAAKDRMVEESKRRLSLIDLTLLVVNDNYKDEYETEVGETANTNKDSYEATTYGAKSADLTKKLEDLDKTLDGISESISTAEGAIAEDEISGAIQILSDVIAKLNAAEKDYNDLNSEAAKAKEQYMKEKQARKTVSEKIKSVVAEAGKIDHSVLSEEKANQEAELTKQNNSLENDFFAKELVSAKKDSLMSCVQSVETVVVYLKGLNANEVANDKTNTEFVEGFKMPDIYASIEKTLKPEDIQKAINEKVGSEGCTYDPNEAGAVYFSKQKSGLGTFNGTEYGGELGDIEKARKAAYEARKKYLDGDKPVVGTLDVAKYTDTDKNMAHERAKLEERINTLNSNIAALNDLCVANEVAHYNQKNEIAVLDAKRGEAFAKISGSLNSSYHATAVKELQTQDEKLAAHKKAVEEAFKAGACDTKSVELNAEAATIRTALTNLLDNWDDNYAQAVSADNKARKDEFDAQMVVLEQTYKDAVNLITELSKLSYASSEEVVKVLQEVVGDKGIYTYAEQIRTLKENVQEEYEGTKAPTLFDPTKKNLATAVGYNTTIEGFEKTYSDAVNKAAIDTYNTYVANNGTSLYSQYQTAKTNAKNVLGEAGEPVKAGDIIDEAFDNVNTIFVDANTIAQINNGKSENLQFALDLDNKIIPSFNTVPGLLDADKEAAAVEVYNASIATYRAIEKIETAAIAEFYSEAGVKGAFSENYAEEVAKLLTDAETAWGKIESGKKYEKYADVKGLLDSFQGKLGQRFTTDDDKNNPHYNAFRTDDFMTAYNADKVYHANDVAYNAMKVDVENVQKELEAQKDVVKTLIVQNNNGIDVHVLNIQHDIDSVLTQATEYHKDNIASAKEKEIEDGCKTLMDKYLKKEYIIDAKHLMMAVISAEKAALAMKIGDLQNDYNNAAATNLDDATIDNYKNKISELNAENTVILRDYQEGKKHVVDGEEVFIENDGKRVFATAEETVQTYLALEKKIGNIKAELTAIYNAKATADAEAAITDAIAELNATHAEFVDQLAECHAPVVDEFNDEIVAFKDAIDALQAEFDAEKADNVVLLHLEDNLLTASKVAASVAGKKDAIAAMEKKYDDNDAYYAELTAGSAVLVENLAKINSDAAAYKYQITSDTPWELGSGEDAVEYNNFREFLVAKITKDIADAKKAVDDKNNAGGDKIDETFKNTSVDAQKTIQSNIDKMERRLAYNETESTLNLLCRDVNGLESEISALGYTEDIRKALEERQETLLEMVGNAVNFNDAAYANNSESAGVEKDIKGDDCRVDSNEDGKKEEVLIVKYKEQYPVVMARATELAAEFETLASDIVKESWIKGDVDHSGVVTVNDYNEVRQIVLELISYEESSAKFYAADVDNSGEINISDVTQISQKIMNPNYNYWTVSKSKAMAKAKELGLTTNGSMMFATEGTGLLQTVKIAVNSELQFVGSQFDVILPEGVKIASANSSSHDAMFNTMANGATRVLVSNLENVEIVNGQTFVELGIEVSSDFKGGEIVVKNPLFVESDGTAFSLDVVGGDATGITNLTTVEKMQSKVYSVGGQLMNKMKKGLNIIVGSDGTVKKQVIK